MSIYVNGFNINMNEVLHIECLLNTNGSSIKPVVSITITYENAKMLIEGLTNVIAQHDAKVHQIQSDRAKAN